MKKRDRVSFQTIGGTFSTPRKEFTRAEKAFMEWWNNNKPQRPEAQEAHVLMCWCAFQAAWDMAQIHKESE